MAIRAEDGTACEVCQAEPRILLNHPDALQRIQAKRAARRTDGASTQDAPRPIPAYARPPTLAMEFEGGARPEGVSIRCVRVIAVVVWVSIRYVLVHPILHYYYYYRGQWTDASDRSINSSSSSASISLGLIALWIYPR